MEESTRHNRTSIRILLVSLMIIALAVTLQQVPGSPAYKPTLQPRSSLLANPSVPNATIAVSPNETIDLGRTMSFLPIQITIDNSTAGGEIKIVGYEVLLSYDPDVLTAVSINYDNSILYSASNSLVIVRDCLDGNPAPGQPSSVCSSDDGPGFSSFAATILGATTGGITSGELFTITFSVNLSKPAFSQIQIKRAGLGNGLTDPDTHKPVVVPSNTKDGFYASIDCGGSVCRPPTAEFSWKPVPAKQKSLTIFNANASVPGPGATGIIEYSWLWNDGSQNPYSVFCGRPDPSKCSGDSRLVQPLNSTAEHVFQTSGTYLVTLTVTDSHEIPASKTYQVRVINADVNIGIDSIDVEPTPIGASPGTIFKITATLKNYGGVQANRTYITLTLVLTQNVTIAISDTKDLGASNTMTVTGTWDSSGRVPNVYRIDAVAPFQTNSTGWVLETNRLDNAKSTWIQLIFPQPASLGLLPTTGLAAVAVAVLGYAVAWLRKRSIPIEV